jgi:hypothetical protein
MALNGRAACVPSGKPYCVSAAGSHSIARTMNLFFDQPARQLETLG